MSPRVTVALIWTLKLGLGAVLIVAGWAKAVEGAAFAEQIANFQLLPALAPLLALVLPTSEIVVGAALIAAPRRSAWTPAAALGGALLFAVFTGAVGHVLLRGIDVSCGCFGGTSSAADGLTLVRNLGLLAASAVLFGYTWKQR